MNRWTPEAEEMLRDLWRKGDSASQIAEQLPELNAGKTRPAQRPTRDMVIGKARRLGLKGRPSPIRQKEAAE